MKCSHLASVLSGLLSCAAAVSTFVPARPPAIPLAVRNPYLSTWLQAGSDGGNGGYLPGQWPTFWTGQVTAWTGLIKVDGLTYIWMGAPTANISLATQLAFNYTSTRSTFTLQAGNTVGMVVEFLSPVIPDDYLRSSLASSYLNVQVYSIDGQAHSVQLYTDISGEWVSGERNDVIQWSNGVVQAPPKHKRSEIAVESVLPQGAKHYTEYGTKTSFIVTKPSVSSTTTYTRYSPTSYPYVTYGLQAANATAIRPHAPKRTAKPGVLYHTIFRQVQSFPDEASDQALWGNFYYATDNTINTTFQIAADVLARGNFINNGYLPDTVDSYFRAINVAYPVFAHAKDLGMVGAAPVAALWTINLMQTPVISYENGLINQNVTLPGLWTKYFNDDLDAVYFAYNDFAKASKLSTQTDNKIYEDSMNISENYTTISTLAVRQAFGALQLAANTSVTGQTSFYVFLKEISSDGNIQTVDVIFPLHPILIYLNPTWLKLLLEPLFINQEAGYWPYQFSIHDLGTHYPVAQGNNDGIDEMQPLEECGDMIIMSLAYAQRTDDNAWLSSHYSILRQWNQYLIDEALIPQNQISTDDFAGALANQTNLAIKGIIGIAAMAEIANRTGNYQDGINFTQIAQSYITQWQTLAIAADAPVPHTTLNYGFNDTYSLLYNIFADKELNLGLVPNHVYNIQSKFYPTVALEYGVPLDTRHTYTKSDWQIFCAAVAHQKTANLFYDKIAYWINNTPTNLPMTDLYDAATGNYPGFDFIARPVVGGLFAPLALKSAPKKAAFQS